MYKVSPTTCPRVQELRQKARCQRLTGHGLLRFQQGLHPAKLIGDGGPGRPIQERRLLIVSTLADCVTGRRAKFAPHKRSGTFGVADDIPPAGLNARIRPRDGGQQLRRRKHPVVVGGCDQEGECVGVNQIKKAALIPLSGPAPAPWKIASSIGTSCPLPAATVTSAVLR